MNRISEARQKSWGESLLWQPRGREAGQGGTQCPEAVKGAGVREGRPWPAAGAGMLGGSCLQAVASLLLSLRSQPQLPWGLCAEQALGRCGLNLHYHHLQPWPVPRRASSSALPDLEGTMNGRA